MPHVRSKKSYAAVGPRCLAKVEELFEAQRKKGCPISGVIVEPIQAEGGDHHGSKEWFQVSTGFFCL